jgi:hypothetical protein
MNKQFCAVGFAGAIVSTLGLLGFAAPASACHSIERLETNNFNDCRMIAVVGGPPSRSKMAAYKARQAQQLTMTIAAYHSSFSANMARSPIRETLMTHRLQTGELTLSSIVLITADHELIGTKDQL